MLLHTDPRGAVVAAPAESAARHAWLIACRVPTALNQTNRVAPSAALDAVGPHVRKSHTWTRLLLVDVSLRRARPEA